MVRARPSLRCVQCDLQCVQRHTQMMRKANVYLYDEQYTTRSANNKYNRWDTTRMTMEFG